MDTVNEIVLRVAIIIFVVMEFSNVLILYIKPNFKYGNGVGVFNGYEKSKDCQERKLFVRYLVNWVANCKLIFIVLLVVVLLVGDATALFYSVIAMIISIAMYFATLHPIICKLDKSGEITPKGYSKVLAIMIGGFMLMFSVALILSLLI